MRKVKEIKGEIYEMWERVNEKGVSEDFTREGNFSIGQSVCSGQRWQIMKMIARSVR